MTVAPVHGRRMTVAPVHGRRMTAAPVVGRRMTAEVGAMNTLLVHEEEGVV